MESLKIATQIESKKYMPKKIADFDKTKLSQLTPKMNVGRFLEKEAKTPLKIVNRVNKKKAAKPRQSKNDCLVNKDLNALMKKV